MLLQRLSAHDRGIRMRLDAFEYAYLNTKDYWYVFRGDLYMSLLSVQYEANIWTTLEEGEGRWTTEMLREEALQLGVRIDEMALDMLDIIRLYRFTMPSLSLNRIRGGGFTCNSRSNF